MGLKRFFHSLFVGCSQSFLACAGQMLFFMPLLTEPCVVLSALRNQINPFPQ